MPLHLIHGPPNSGRAGLVRERLEAVSDRDPVLVVPTLDDVYAFERELCADNAALGVTATTFAGLFRLVAAVGDVPAPVELTPAQRRRAIAVAVDECRGRLGALRSSAGRAGFAGAFERLLEELQAGGLRPGDVEAGAGTLESSAYLTDVATLFAEYEAVRERIGMADSHGVARRAIALLTESPTAWQRPVFMYGLDDLTANQFGLLGALTANGEVTFVLPYEEGHAAIAARTAALLERLRALGVGSETQTEPDPRHTDDPLLFHLERSFGRAIAERRPPTAGLAVLRSAGERGEAEAIGAEVARLLAGGGDPGEVAIALRSPERRGPLLASVLESYGIPVALEAEIPLTATSLGGTLLSLLAALQGGSAGELLRFMRGPSGLPRGQVDWFERSLRRRRLRTAAEALDLWQERYERLPTDVTAVRAAMDGPADRLAGTVARLAATMASRPLRDGDDGPAARAEDDRELRAAAATASALAELADRPALAPAADRLVATLEGIRFRAWSGPVAGRVRIASPQRLRAARFDHVFVASLQDGEFPRHERGDPFLSEAQRAALGLEARRDTEAEERYLFHACLALPRRRLFLSYRDSDENGAAEAPSPLLDDVRRLIEPPPEAGTTDADEGAVERGRDLARVVHRVGDAPSERELARAAAAHGADADLAALLAAAEVEAPVAERVAARVEAAREVDARSRAPGPLANPAALGELAAVSAYGGTTLELFDQCSYRWFVSHELDPRPLDPAPDALVQGGLMHAVLERLYGERPGGDTLPRARSLAAWKERGRALVVEEAVARGLGGNPAERAIVRRVEGLLDRFIAEEAERDGRFEPWLLEARFGEDEACERPPLDLGEWRLHGAIDRVDRDPAGRALVVDYKLAGSVTPRAKLEEQAKLQLQLYMIAVAEQWGAEPVGGLYHPLRGTRSRRPRGLALEEAAAELGPYALARTDLLDREAFDELLEDARRRAGAIVARMRQGEIRRDPGPRAALRGHDVCPSFCDFAPICRRDRAPVEPSEEDEEER
ncbi:MAG TPA: PD-(D/E)XK nuclease family protein [Solirubrobacterales bacterium]|nr:PD-(D/E)XK nuclease family protein [Solirubrobacterales bacterium]